jgi:asparagine N-glycosylation enzyme membrane subunit Stt3
MSAKSASVGDVDHHTVVALLGATLLAFCLQLSRPDVSARRLAAASLGLALAMAATILTWSGSLLYVAVAHGALLVAAVAVGGRPRLWAQAAAAAGAAVLVTPWLAVAETGLGGPFSTTNASWFHPVALGAVAVLCGILALAGRAWSDGGWATRGALALGAAMLVGGAVLLAFPALRESLVPALAFLSKRDTWGAVNLEQQPIFFGPLQERMGAAGLAHRQYGLLAYAIPLTPLAGLVLAREARARAPAACFACWTLVFGALAVAQLRFGADFAPAGCVGFALLLGAVGRWVPAPFRSAAVVVLGIALLWPGLAATYPARLRTVSSFASREGPLSEAERSRGELSLARFARRIREVTPETSGYLDRDGRPEYGVLCPASDGHTILYMARRATPAGNFGPYLDPEKYLAVGRFYRVPEEETALALAEQLEVRYLLTQAHRGARQASFADRLHLWDGAGGRGEEASGRLRLVLEGPVGGVTPHGWFREDVPPRGRVPYKLFEIVEGAVLEARGAPGEVLTVEIRIETSLERRFRYRATARADRHGVARLRVPYATDGDGPVRTLGPYRVRFADAEIPVHVGEAEVMHGEVVPVSAPRPEPGGAAPTSRRS